MGGFRFRTSSKHPLIRTIVKKTSCIVNDINWAWESDVMCGWLMDLLNPQNAFHVAHVCLNVKWSTNAYTKLDLLSLRDQYFQYFVSPDKVAFDTEPRLYCVLFRTSRKSHIRCLRWEWRFSDISHSYFAKHTTQLCILLTEFSPWSWCLLLPRSLSVDPSIANILKCLSVWGVRNADAGKQVGDVGSADEKIVGYGILY